MNLLVHECIDLSDHEIQDFMETLFMWQLHAFIISLTSINLSQNGGELFVVKLRADQILSKKSRHKLFHTDWSPTKKIYRDFNKILLPVHNGVCCCQQTNPNEPGELTEFKYKAYDFFICLHKNDLVNDTFW